jgi:hypothetical protein
VKRTEEAVRDVVDVYCTVISRRYGRGTEEDHEGHRAGLGSGRRSNHRTLDTIMQCQV